MIVEFIGLPCSGKSYNYFKLKKILKNKIYSYIDIYYIYLKKISYLNFFQSIFFKISYNNYNRNNKNINFYNIGYKKKNKFILFIYIKKVLKKIIDKNEEKIKKKFLKNIKKKEKKILKIFYDCVKRSPLQINEKKILKDRVEKEFIALVLIKKMKLDKFIIVNDEGFLQRILTSYQKEKSLNENKKKMFNFFNKFQSFFKINFAIMTKTNIDKILIRSKIRKKGFKYNNFSSKELEKWNKLFDSFFLNSKIKVFKNHNTKKIVNLIQKKNK